MEWSSYGPMVLAVVLFLLVGTIIERRIEGAIRRVLDHRQAQMQANQTNQSSDQPTNQSTNQPPNQQDPDDGRNSRTTSATFTKSAMTSNSSIIRRPIPPIRAGTKSSEPLLKSAFRSKSSTLEFK
ncbi:uncharacterized protein LOC120631910 [Pararge aegeria]|uniref:uncharacterized protein LOC120631910 n=1 Tax=Pararge aegeria TaxID=116150 RepID=UPI0019D0E552|nr:uncharacterized protein LOC120631910 [Pararge aegeria]XP_039757529.1 uncharacterized protein LOC120631910 [Pararge aegeria]XP_039757530.1 uncharacterized protein LOC120631910 [Pararge aegeria]